MAIFYLKASSIGVQPSRLLGIQQKQKFRLVARSWNEKNEKVETDTHLLKVDSDGSELRHFKRPQAPSCDAK